jgi:hypothetical protein
MPDPCAAAAAAAAAVAVSLPCVLPRSFLEDKVHAKEVLVEKLALKNTTYRTAIQKLEAQLAHKEEMGEVRRAAAAQAGALSGAG